MICAICGGPVEWQGPMSALSHTQCLSCGQTNCQASEGKDLNEKKEGKSSETDPR